MLLCRVAEKSLRWQAWTLINFKTPAQTLLEGPSQPHYAPAFSGKKNPCCED